ncbi:MAG: hypothetical protein KC609_24405 [Myxococcales bacterium]|nr:hypothetical protein [Myxococcales bacterium]
METPSFNKATLIRGIVLALVVLLGLYFVLWRWMFSRIYVGPGETLILKANVGKDNPDPINLQVVPNGYKGVLRDVVGEGRHFYNPLTYSRTVVRNLVEIKSNEVGIVVSKSGKPLPNGVFLADTNDYKGVLREPLTPGLYRLNPMAFQVIKAPVTVIRPGYVGNVTALHPDPKHGVKNRGILPTVLQPGRYYINPKAYQVEEVEIGYRHLKLADVTFKSIDSFDIKLDITVVWGIKPINVPKIINELGNIDDVIAKIITPQVNTIVRIEGSRHQAQQFIEGDARKRFQEEFTAKLKSVCASKNIDILIGLVRNIEIPLAIRDPINQSKIAAEERTMKSAMGKTQILRNALEDLTADVVKGVRETNAETEKMIAQIQADGEKEVLKTKGETEVEVAKIMKRVAEIEAKIKLVKGGAQAQVIEMLRTAEADAFTQFVKALGSSKALSGYIFTKNLPKNLKIEMRYSGNGTFWTDLPPGNDALKRGATLKILSK